MKKIKKYFEAGTRPKLSMIVMGLGQMLQGQWIKGLIYFSMLVLYIWFMVSNGATDIKGFFTLGETKADAWLGIEGDDSIMLMLKGIIAYAVTILFAGMYISNVKDAYESELKLKKNGELPGFFKSVSIFMDKRFYVAALAIPVVGVVTFNILPIAFMILIAFTNYGGDIIPLNLYTGLALIILKRF